jgi:hypothetical protein
MSYLDQWLQYIGTEEVLPLFERLEIDYKIPKLDDVDWEALNPLTKAVACDRNLAQLRKLDSEIGLQEILQVLEQHDEKKFLRDVYTQMLSLAASDNCELDSKIVAKILLEFLPNAIYLIPVFLQSQTWRTHKSRLEDNLIHLGPTLLSKLVLATNELQSFVRQPFAHLLQELRQISLQNFAELVELVSLSVRSPEMAMDLLLEILEPETSRLLVGRPQAVRQFVKCLFGIAFDHIDEASNSRKAEAEFIQLAVTDYQDGFAIVKSSLRIDSALGGYLKVGDHVRLTVSNQPLNAPLAKPFSMDALVLKAEPGSATFRCLHEPPSYSVDCAWAITHCGSFVTSKTMFDAVAAFYTQREVCCRIYALIAGLPDGNQIELPGMELPVIKDANLNASQNAALEAAMTHLLTFIWGPPGTGKTHTVVVILTQLLIALPNSRFLVTAPTHNAVDNLMRRFIADPEAKKVAGSLLRVSTQVCHNHITR